MPQSSELKRSNVEAEMSNGQLLVTVRHNEIRSTVLTKNYIISEDSEESVQSAMSEQSRQSEGDARNAPETCTRC